MKQNLIVLGIYSLYTMAKNMLMSSSANNLGFVISFSGSFYIFLMLDDANAHTDSM